MMRNPKPTIDRQLHKAIQEYRSTRNPVVAGRVLDLITQRRSQ